ncbi:hypothetical protein CVT24_002876 [Panaeolus cyanescens]|uniref:DUF302 domain-containing protein n=1 Tax=Panaeolus cyanescens TaxID=181874 RepID=A0A409YRL4_9AGAR|nr:hypothetical protein CVT24_002876 [Panaeolus cyanescens]
MSSPTKAVLPLPSAHFLVWETNLPTTEVLARLDFALNKDGATGFLPHVNEEMKTQQELVDKIHSVIDGHGNFVFFNTIPLHKLTGFRTGDPNPPRIVVYTFGNPLYAQRVIKLNPIAAANIPPRIVVVENENKDGTRVAYNLPSSIMMDPFGKEDEELKTELLGLDKKIEELVLEIIKA